MTDYTASFQRLRKKYDFQSFGDDGWEKIPNKDSDKIRWSACVWNTSLEKAKKRMATTGKANVKKTTVNKKRNEEIIKLVDEGYSRKEIAKIMGMSAGNVSHIVKQAKGDRYKATQGGMAKKQAIAYRRLHEQIRRLYEEGYSGANIAKELEKPKSTVYKHLKRIRIEDAFGEEG